MRDDPEKLTCACDHNTEGRSCERCIEFYNDQPWAKATADNAHECKGNHRIRTRQVVVVRRV